MRVYLQWALAVPEDWESFDVTGNAQIRNAAKKAEPTGGETLDQTPGWLVSANIQGVIVDGWDHVALEYEKIGQGQSAEDKLTLTGWNDDPDDWPVGERWASRWTFLPVNPDGTTRQTQQFYADAGGEQHTWLSANNTILPFEDLPEVPSRNVFHGIWVTDQSYADHRAMRTTHGYADWMA